MKSHHNFKRDGAVLLLALVIFLCEPFIRTSVSFAVTQFAPPKVSPANIPSALHQPVEDIRQDHPTPQKSHAPEPSTLFIFASGLSGIIVRFARKRFEEFKRISDVLLSVAGLIAASPILICAAVLIKLTSCGPALYRQCRVGKDGRLFQIYKLRTMRNDAELKSGAVWAKENDPRITPIGRVLRKTHIDEIPQLFNVLKGEMSIVGPRPERPEMIKDLKEVICDYEKRLRVKPGVTGLAQVWHKYDETIADVRKKIKFDLLYIKRMCLWVDLRIIASTFVVVLTGRGAR